jgi:hypothetical protein
MLLKNPVGLNGFAAGAVPRGKAYPFGQLGQGFQFARRRTFPMATELRNRMIADMRSAGLAASTQEVYIQSVRGLAAYYRRSPDLLSEAEVRGYLLHLRDGRGVARGTYAPYHGGIRFLFAHTLDRDWPLFLKKESARPSVSVCPLSYPMPKPGLSLAA